MTEFIIRPRQTGKTYELLQRMAEDPDLSMVCASQQQADWVAEQAKAHGVTDPSRFLRPDAAIFLNQFPRSSPPRYLVDNAELVLAALLKANIVAMTGTGPKD